MDYERGKPAANAYGLTWRNLGRDWRINHLSRQEGSCQGDMHTFPGQFSGGRSGGGDGVLRLGDKISSGASTRQAVLGKLVLSHRCTIPHPTYCCD